MNSLGLAVVFAALGAASAGYYGGLLSGMGTPAVISGPSGMVLQSGISQGGIYSGAAGLVAAALSANSIMAPGYGYGALPRLLAYGSGLEGQYIPDNRELLHDDGSYKPYLYGH